MALFCPWFTPFHEKVFEDTATALLHQKGARFQMGAVSVPWLVFNVISNDVTIPESVLVKIVSKINYQTSWSMVNQNIFP